MAKTKVMIDNDITKVTKWVFEIDEETGEHTHEHDYVIVPLLDRELKIVDESRCASVSKLAKGESYFRKKGVTHNVKNNNKFQYSFVEIEIK